MIILQWKLFLIFQRENWVVESLDTLWAWHFGKNTRKALEEYLKQISKKTKNSVWSISSDLIIWENFKENFLKTKNKKQKKVIWKTNFKASKEDIFSFTESASVKQIQELLKQWKKVDDLWDFDDLDWKSDKNVILDIS